MAGKKPRGGGPNRRRGSLRRDDREEEVTEYEKQRQERIKENQEKLEVLGLKTISSSLRSQGREPAEEVSDKEREEEEEEEYLPSDHDSSDDREEDEGNGGGQKRSKGKRKNQNLEGNARRKSFPETFSMDMESIDEDDALQKAISLSLGEPVKSSEALQDSRSPSYSKSSPINVSVRKEKSAGTVGRGKRTKGNARRVQISEDEAVAYFFSIDEAGKGGISIRDLLKMAITHDFNWSDREMADMIRFFDTDGDGKLNFGDFRNILSRCHVIQEPSNS